MTGGRVLGVAAALLASALVHVAVAAILPEIEPQQPPGVDNTRDSSAGGASFASLVEGGALRPVAPESNVQVPVVPARAPTPPLARVGSPARTTDAPAAATSLAPLSPATATQLAPDEEVGPVERADTPPTRAPKPRPESVASPEASAPSPARSRPASGNAGPASAPKAAASPAAIDAWKSAVIQTIRRQRQTGAGRGAATVDFTIMPSGQLAGLSLSGRSGSSRVDAAALRVIRRAAPFPPPPSGRAERLRVVVEGRR